MKKYILMGSMLLSQFAFAEGPRIEPGRPIQLEDGAVNIASVLMDSQLSGCVQQFQAGHVAVTSITQQNLAPGKTHYKIEGVILMSGHVPVGRRMMLINEVAQNEPGLHQRIARTCRVLNLPNPTES